MKSFFDPNVLAELESRAAKLTPDTPHQWGKMSVSQMLAHCQAPIEIALGERTLKRGILAILVRAGIRRSILLKEYLRKAYPPHPLVVKDERRFEQERSKLLEKVRRLSQGGKSALIDAPHPFFGKLTFDEWGIMQYKHLDHHLRQFGV